MAKIDTTAIQGFEGMSAEDKVSALLAVEIPEALDMSKYISKATFDKTSSELADLKKQLNAKLTEEEKQKLDSEATMKDLQAKYDALLKESTIAKYKAEYLAQGYSDELAAETASALFAGDTAKVFANGKKFRETVEKQVLAEAMKKTPKPDGDDGNGGDKKPESMKLAERIGKNTAEADKAALDIINKYTTGGNN